MRCRLKTLFQRKFKDSLLFLLLLALLVHLAMDLSLPTAHRPCGCDAKAVKGSEITSGSAVLAGCKKLSLRILQDFSGSNSSLEKSSQLQGAGPQARDGELGAQLQHGDGSLGKTKGSKLASLFKHPLYNIPIPEVTEKDKLFVVNPMEKFSLHSSGSDEWTPPDLFRLGRMVNSLLPTAYFYHWSTNL
ncbi:hypothetical protein Q9966_002151 [Columba livia]|nr:hypothetical protein Q9966_002151 [Columba livia]